MANFPGSQGNTTPTIPMFLGDCIFARQSHTGPKYSEWAGGGLGGYGAPLALSCAHKFRRFLLQLPKIVQKRSKSLFWTVFREPFTYLPPVSAGVLGGRKGPMGLTPMAFFALRAVVSRSSFWAHLAPCRRIPFFWLGGGAFWVPLPVRSGQRWTPNHSAKTLKAPSPLPKGRLGTR